MKYELYQSLTNHIKGAISLVTEKKLKKVTDHEVIELMVSQCPTFAQTMDYRIIIDEYIHRITGYNTMVIKSVEDAEAAYAAAPSIDAATFTPPFRCMAIGVPANTTLNRLKVRACLVNFSMVHEFETQYKGFLRDVCKVSANINVQPFTKGERAVVEMSIMDAEQQCFMRTSVPVSKLGALLVPSANLSDLIPAYNEAVGIDSKMLVGMTEEDEMSMLMHLRLYCGMCHVINQDRTRMSIGHHLDYGLFVDDERKSYFTFTAK